MLAFLDESGCPGMKLGEGATDFFTVALLLFADAEAAVAAERRISQLRIELRFRPDFEFHFNKLRPDFREAFLRAIAPLPFRYYAASIDKHGQGADVLSTPREMYRFACGLALDAARDELQNATVIFDGRGSPVFQREVAAELRRRVNDQKGPPRIAKIKFQDSHRNDLLQMADLICGAVARCHTGRPDAQSCRAIITHREAARLVWP
jgi:hypothetical protein